jgi:hypothetical protein
MIEAGDGDETSIEADTKEESTEQAGNLLNDRDEDVIF